MTELKLGAATVQRFREEGAKVAVFDLNAAPGPGSYKVDITDEAQVSAAVQRIIGERGRLDVLINNAGFAQYGPVEEVSIDAARYQFEVNLFGPARLTQLLLPAMRAKKSGKIINVSSAWGMVGNPTDSHYCGAKAALLGTTKSWAKEYAPWNITVNAIAPGMVMTEMALALPEEFLAKAKGESVLPELATPEDIANAVLFLLGVLLFAMTFALNLVAARFVRRAALRAGGAA